jgi:hypothetical protein
MTITIVQSLQSFFSAAIDRALARCAIEPGPDVTAYLQHVLTARAKPSAGSRHGVVADNGSLVIALDQARSTQPSLRAAAYISVGEQALCAHGFFERSEHRAVYEQIGSLAYREAVLLLDSQQTLVPLAPETMAPQKIRSALDELSVNFVQYALVVSELAVAASLGETTRDLVKLYEAWRHAPCPSAVEALAQAGAFPTKTEADA